MKSQTRNFIQFTITSLVDCLQLFSLIFFLIDCVILYIFYVSQPCFTSIKKGSHSGQRFAVHVILNSALFLFPNIKLKLFSSTMRYFQSGCKKRTEVEKICGFVFLKKLDPKKHNSKKVTFALLYIQIYSDRNTCFRVFLFPCIHSATLCLFFCMFVLYKMTCTLCSCLTYCC